MNEVSPVESVLGVMSAILDVATALNYLVAVAAIGVVLYGIKVYIYYKDTRI